MTDISIGESVSPAILKARNIGAMIDSNCGLHAHVNMVCRSICYHLQRFGKIRKYLDVSAAKIAIQALVTSKLDYLNGLLHGIPACQLAKLQHVQNTAARIVSRVPRRYHITPVLHTLHWLPIKCRVQCKVLILTHKAIHSEEP